MRCTTAASPRKVSVHVQRCTEAMRGEAKAACNFSSASYKPKPALQQNGVSGSWLVSAVSMASCSGAEAPGGNVNVPATAVAITVARSPPAARLSELGVKSWPKWGGPRGSYALSYRARQTCYIVRGRVTATVEEGSSERAIEFGSGDLVIFAKGTRCTWHIAAAVDMHYAFDPS